jgi:hypothetical protein
MQRSPYNTEIKGIRKFILGEINPPWYSQIIVLLGFFTWIWFFFGNLFGLLALKMIRTNSEEKIRQSFERIGTKYGLTNVMELYFNMSLTGLIGSVFMLAGLIFIWRQWAIGYISFITGIILCVLSPMIFMSYDFLIYEQSAMEYVLPIMVLGLVFVDMYLRRRKVTG